MEGLDERARWRDDEIFSDAKAYDLAFAWDVTRELDVVLALAGVNSGARLLLPACGTGRYALALAERGFVVDASDINEGMLAVARSRPHSRVSYSLADMTASFPDAPAVAAAFTFTNSFRYVLTDESVAGHLRAVYDRLQPGGSYIIDLGFTHGDAPGCGASWTVQYDDQIVRASWTLVSTRPPYSVERARIVVEDADGRVREVAAEQPQRIWSFAALERAASRARFRMRGAFLSDGARASEPSTGRYFVALDRL